MTRSRIAAAALVALVVGTVLLLSHPYTGVRHDGILYAGEALERLFPGQIRDDLYFSYGSQGRFTVMPVLYAQLVSLFGLGPGTMIGLLCSLALFVAGSALLVTTFVRPSLRAASVLSVVVGWSLYGGLRIFGYSEAFLTARSFAEPVVLFALAVLMRGRTRLAVALLLGSIVIHPLIGAGGLLAAWVFLALGDRRWWWLGAAGAACLAALGGFGIGPFADLFATYDTQWLTLLHEVNSQAFVLSWSSLDYGVVAFAATVLLFAARSTDEPRTRRFVHAVLAASLGALLVSFVMVDLLGNPLFGKLQIWRALWILQWTAMALTPSVLVTLYRRDEVGRLTAFVLTFGWIAPFSVAPLYVAAIAIAAEVFRHRLKISRVTTLLVGGLAVVAAAVIAIQYEARLVKLASVMGSPLSGIVGQALAMNIILMALGLAALRWLPRAWWSVAIMGVVFAFATTLWDQRSEWTREIESHPLGTSIWPNQIAPDAKVYWYRDLIAPWILLGRANYYTQQQGSGAVFSHDLVVELNRRRALTNLLDFQEQICRLMNNLNGKETSCEPDASAVRSVCDDGGIDYVVLQSTLTGATPTASFSTGIVENGYEKKFYLFRCSELKPAT